MTNRIAMWSGPRNLSTALMYSFAARGDTQVIDEPFYASHLAATGAEHPMRQAVIGSQPTDPDAVVALLTAPVPRPVFYQKHMTHHVLPCWPLDWMAQMQNVFLIRHPARVVASYVCKRERPALDDLGFAQQARLLAKAANPIIVDSSDIRARPKETLQKLCAALDLEWTNNMLRWPPGGHPADGIWAAHWYGAVHRSTGFDGPEGPMPMLTGDYANLVEAALPYYEGMVAGKLT